MRDWNMDYARRETIFGRVSSLPMRDWNRFLVLKRQWYYLVSSLPMRDWNLAELGRWLEVASRLVAYLWGIETNNARSNTNSNIGGLVAYLWGIETHLHSNRIGARKVLVAYLWGIETSRSLSAIMRCRIVSSLPMRDWNFLSIVYGFGSGPS